MAMTEQDKDAARERLAALIEARDSGATEVRYRDRIARYRSLTEITALIDQLRNEIDDKPRTRRPRTFGVYSRKGI